MGVVNITPNSFSDSISMLKDSSALLLKVENFKKVPGLIFDFGLESTAPMNRPITYLEERRRFDYFFEVISDVDLNECWISFDTYRPQNFLYFEERFKSRYSNCGYIFNDVSGVIDSALIDLLKNKKNTPHFYYIHNFTHIPDREKVLDHMSYVFSGDIVKETKNYFEKNWQVFKELGIEEKIIFDPGFGFSKSYEQNWDLIKHFDELHEQLKNCGMSTPWLIGLSKKSFLRKSVAHGMDPFIESEKIHQKIIKDMQINSRGQLIFRAHDPTIIESI